MEIKIADLGGGRVRPRDPDPVVDMGAVGGCFGKVFGVFWGCVAGVLGMCW